MSDELHQIEQVLALAIADETMGSDEKIELLKQTCDRLLSSLRTERQHTARAEASALVLTHAQADAWKLIGRCDLAFELISTARSIATAKQTAKKLQGEIKRAAGGES